MKRIQKLIVQKEIAKRSKCEENYLFVRKPFIHRPLGINLRAEFPRHPEARLHQHRGARSQSKAMPIAKSNDQALY
jgi:hypothetical protein